PVRPLAQLRRLAVELLLLAVALAGQGAQAAAGGQVPGGLEAVVAAAQLQHQFALGLLDLDLALQDQVADPVDAVAVGALADLPAVWAGVPLQAFAAVVAHEVGDERVLAALVAQAVAVVQVGEGGGVGAGPVAEGLAAVQRLPGLAVAVPALPLPGGQVVGLAVVVVDQAHHGQQDLRRLADDLEAALAEQLQGPLVVGVHELAVPAFLLRGLAVVVLGAPVGAEEVEVAAADGDGLAG